uniref:Uncharacterized protein n=1 Tax=Cucumis melo TaxID=3656 RepID=A0A9I9E5Q0_CUCME
MMPEQGDMRGKMNRVATLPFVIKINVYHNLDVVDFELVIVVDSEIYVVLVPLGSLVLVGTLVLHSTDIRCVLDSHVRVQACKNLMDRHQCIKTMDRPLNHNILVPTSESQYPAPNVSIIIIGLP